MAKLLSINISTEKGTKKTPVDSATIDMQGIVGDAHSGPWHRMVSLLARESIQKMKDKGATVENGDFAENLTTEGLDLLALPLGTQISIGGSVVLSVTQHGKECHAHCAIYHQVGDCVMPKEGIFAEVVSGGTIKTGDEITVLNSDD